MARDGRSVARLAPGLSNCGSSAISAIKRPDARAPLRSAGSLELASFAAIGLLCTLLFLGAYQLLRIWLAPLAANLVALSATAGLNFVANREFTFPDPKGSIISQAWRYAVFYILGLGLSSLALYLFLLVRNEAPRPVELTAALLAGGLGTAVRYVTMSRWVFPTGGS